MFKIRGFLIAFSILGFFLFSIHVIGADSKSSPWASNPFIVPDPGMAYGSKQFNSVPGRYDRNGDGRIDLIIVDRNGDGWGDYWATDRDFDGLTDDYQYDRNFDGKVDQWEYDNNHDGIAEKILVDSNSDGKPDMDANLKPGTKAYSWSGKLPGIAASGGVFSKKRSFTVKGLAVGHAAFSF